MNQWVILSSSVGDILLLMNLKMKIGTHDTATMMHTLYKN